LVVEGPECVNCRVIADCKTQNGVNGGPDDTLTNGRKLCKTILSPEKIQILFLEKKVLNFTQLCVRMATQIKGKLVEMDI